MVATAPAQNRVRQPPGGWWRAANALAIAGCVVMATLSALPAAWMVLGAWRGKDGWTARNLLALLQDGDRLLVLLKNTVITTGGAVVVALVLGVPAGYLCFRTRLPGRRLLIGGALVAACLPPYIIGTCWIALCGAGFWYTLPSWWQRAVGAAWLSGLAAVPLALLISGAAFAAVNPEMEDQALLDASRPTVWRRVSLPLGAWGMVMAGAVVALLNCADITITDILQVRSFAEESYTQFMKTSEPWTASVAALPVMLVIALLALLAWHLFRHHAEAAVFSGRRGPPLLNLGRWRWWCLGLVATMMVLVAGLPFAGLLWALGTPGQLLKTAGAVAPDLALTLALAPATATLALALALPLGWVAVRRRGLGRPVWLLVLLLVAMPAPVVGVGVITLCNHPALPPGVYNSLFPLCYVYFMRTLPYGILVLAAALRGVPRELEDAATLDGANWLQRLVLVLAPQCWPSLLIAWFLMFVLALGEIGATCLVVPPGQATVSVRFFNFIHYGVYPDTAALCLLVLLGVLVPAAALGWLLRPRERGTPVAARPPA